MARSANHTILINAFAGDFLDGDDIGVFGQPAHSVYHLRQAATRMLGQNVQQQQRERLTADQLARAPYRVLQAERLLLPGETGRAGRRQVVVEESSAVASGGSTAPPGTGIFSKKNREAIEHERANH
jgi:hypothetical protein